MNRELRNPRLSSPHLFSEPDPASRLRSLQPFRLSQPVCLPNPLPVRTRLAPAAPLQLARTSSSHGSARTALAGRSLRAASSMPAPVRLPLPPLARAPLSLVGAPEPSAHAAGMRVPFSASPLADGSASPLRALFELAGVAAMMALFVGAAILL